MSKRKKGLTIYIFMHLLAIRYHQRGTFYTTISAKAFKSMIAPSIDKDVGQWKLLHDGV